MKRNALVGWKPVSDVNTFADGDDEVCLVALGGTEKRKDNFEKGVPG